MFILKIIIYTYGGDRKVTAFALTHWMKIFWVKTQKSVVESYEEATIF